MKSNVCTLAQGFSIYLCKMWDSSSILYIFCHSIPVTIRFQRIPGFWVVDRARKLKEIEKFEQVPLSHRHTHSWIYFAIVSALPENRTWSDKVIRKGSTVHPDFYTLHFYLQLNCLSLSNTGRYFLLISMPRCKFPHIFCMRNLHTSTTKPTALWENGHPNFPHYLGFRLTRESTCTRQCEKISSQLRIAGVIAG